jgi:hypothetical protein
MIASSDIVPVGDMVVEIADLTMEEKYDADIAATSHITLSVPSNGEICLICFDPIDSSSNYYKLSCGHKFCFPCLCKFLESNIVEGKVAIKCFHNKNELMIGGISGNKSNNSEICNTLITDTEIRDILAASDCLPKYIRFKTLKENVYARECPECMHIDAGDPLKPAMTCSSCQFKYCLVHATAHPPTTSCAEYERSIESETKLNSSVISTTSKQCPGCQMYVSKTGGCNHMKVFALYYVLYE